MFNKGDYIKYTQMYRKRFLRKPLEDKEYICSYKNQGEIDVQYELQDGDIFEVTTSVQAHLILKPVSENIPKSNFHTYSFGWVKESMRLLSIDEIKTLRSNIRKRKLYKLKDC